jgi:Carbohydrate esterase, sialic acid-specific acetylesterase
MNYKLLLFLFLLVACTTTKKVTLVESNQFPVVIEKPSSLPAKDKFYIFLLAGQSNMAGRGFVEPEDTLASPLVLALNKNNEWVYAKEPLHFYEPSRTGLDCGLSFGKKLAQLYGNGITIGLVPCAIGGSSIEQWLGDSTYRGVTLYSNLMEKTRIALQYGTIKAILWHQGESNAGALTYTNYKQKLKTFFIKLHNDIGDTALPVYAGQLASFLKKKDNPFAENVNNDLSELSVSFKNFYVITTGDLTPMKDSIHFNSVSQRIMGERFAKKVYTNK